MKNRKVILVRAITLMAAVLMATCTTTQPRKMAKAEEPLYGTWVNDEYGAGNKEVLTSDGKGFEYNRGAAQPYSEYRVTLEEKWTDETGNIFYKGFAKWSGYPYNESKARKWYFLYRINAAGDTLEVVVSPSDYPTEVSKVGGSYWIYHRVE